MMFEYVQGQVPGGDTLESRCQSDASSSPSQLFSKGHRITHIQVGRKSARNRPVEPKNSEASLKKRCLQSHGVPSRLRIYTAPKPLENPLNISGSTRRAKGSI